MLLVFQGKVGWEGEVRSDTLLCSSVPGKGAKWGGSCKVSTNYEHPPKTHQEVTRRRVTKSRRDQSLPIVTQILSQMLIPPNMCSLPHVSYNHHASQNARSHLMISVWWMHVLNISYIQMRKWKPKEVDVCPGFFHSRCQAKTLCLLSLCTLWLCPKAAFY